MVNVGITRKNGLVTLEGTKITFNLDNKEFVFDVPKLKSRIKEMKYRLNAETYFGKLTDAIVMLDNNQLLYIDFQDRDKTKVNFYIGDTNNQNKIGEGDL